MAKYHGREGAVLLGSSGAGAASAVANLSSWSLTIDQALADVTCLGNSFASFVAGIKNAKGSVSGYFDSTTDIPFDAFDSGDAVNCYLYPAGTGVASYWYGQVFVSNVNVEDNVTGAVSIKADIQFNGDCTRVG